MTKQISTHAAAAKLIRAELKRLGYKGTVHSDSYSGGTSIRVGIVEDLTPEQRKSIEAFAHKFQYGHFDGMTDCYEYSNSQKDIPQVRFVFVEVTYSGAIKAEVKRYIGAIGGINEFERDRYEWMALNGSWGDFWKERENEILGLNIPQTEAEKKLIADFTRDYATEDKIANVIDPHGVLRKAGIFEVLVVGDKK